MKGSSRLFFAAFLSIFHLGFAFSEDVPPKLREEINQDLETLKSFEGNLSSPLHQEVFGSLSGKSYDTYFNSRISTVAVGSCLNRDAVACVKPAFDSTRLWLTSKYTQYNHPQIARIMVLLHEARHTESFHRYWSHSLCPLEAQEPDGKPLTSILTGALLGGKAACDKTHLGSYGISVIFLKNISEYCKTCSEKLRMDAQIFANDQMKRIVDPAAHLVLAQDSAGPNP